MATISSENILAGFCVGVLFVLDCSLLRVCVCFHLKSCRVNWAELCFIIIL